MSITCFVYNYVQAISFAASPPRAEGRHVYNLTDENGNVDDTKRASFHI